MINIPIHCILYGRPGAGKSTCAGTFPKPMWVGLFDSLSKAQHPFFRLGEVSGPFDLEIHGVIIKWYLVNTPDGPIHVELFHDSPSVLETGRPDAFSKFRLRMSTLHHEFAYWKSGVIDSITSMALAARQEHEKIFNPLPAGKTKQTLTKGDGVDPRHWYGGATDDLEEYLVVRAKSFPFNLVVICHIAVEKNELNGQLVQSVAAPGRLSKSESLQANFAEQYRVYVGKGEDGEPLHMLQTRTRDGFAASTGIGAPDPCWPSFEGITSLMGKG